MCALLHFFTDGSNIPTMKKIKESQIKKEGSLTSGGHILMKVFGLLVFVSKDSHLIFPCELFCLSACHDLNYSFSNLNLSVIENQKLKNFLSKNSNIIKSRIPRNCEGISFDYRND